MLWKLLCLVTGSSIPIMVVISESMAPAFHRGDIIFLWNRSKLVNVGDIPVVWFRSQPLPMVHRAVQVFGEGVVQHILTKGDNNYIDDVGLYPPGRSWVRRDEVVGIVKGYLPSLGWLTIAANEMPWLRGMGIVFACLIGMVSN
ncbi:S24/S26 family peptidase [Aspergillus ruber CBS 135680]|uniref:Signal peptidase complex catalytic subunit SEC11 n=1 Tax=Aspergillus ruber (strain CBS 135680) TaxID=1388766 RepID=A0A017SB51_ASPRC|nr:uncharacterized protein EURHEDRAFT_516461 [Aspergillus ruber CBS 135680]EYE93859.1 hypothetical protein EURHEDRAFT_516461 [Aspergillus ruber CBS 135680]